MQKELDDIFYEKPQKVIVYMVQISRDFNFFCLSRLKVKFI